MGSILLIILKIIGWIFLILLSIVIFLFVIFFFVPIRYSIKGYIDDHIETKGTVSWFFSAVRYEFSFQNNDWQGTWRIFGKVPTKKEKRVIVEKAEQAEEIFIENAKEFAEQIFDNEQNANPVQKEEREESFAEPVSQNDTQKEKKQTKTKLRKKRKKHKIPDFRQKFVRWKQKGADIKNVCEKIKDTISNPRNKNAVKKIWEEIKYLLHHFGFKKLQTELYFSLADPALTGQALGGLSVFPFLYRYQFHIYPDFESEQYYIKGSYYFCGRIRIIHFGVSGVRLLLEKDIRAFIKTYFK